MGFSVSIHKILPTVNRTVVGKFESNTEGTTVSPVMSGSTVRLSHSVSDWVSHFRVPEKEESPECNEIFCGFRRSKICERTE